VLKDALGNTIWTVDQVNAANLFPCGPANAIQAANSAVNGLTCDSQITINTTTHVLSAHAIITSSMLVNGVTVGPLGTPTTWNFDTTTPATAAASLGITPGSVIDTGTINQLAFYAAAGTELSGTSAIPAGITVTTQTPSDNSTNPASTAYVALPGAINPTSLKIASGVAMTDNQGNGAKVQHSTGTTTTGHPATFDANGNIIDNGAGCNNPTIHRVTGSRASTTIYQNTSLCPMTLNISMNYGSVGSLFIQVGSLVDVTAGSAIVLQNAADSQASGTVTVPPSSYYNAYVDVGGTPSYWIETY
jgi:hypothetical protein